VGALTWTWDYFFVPQNQATPDGTGFGVFSAIHLGVLGLLGVGIVALVLAYRHSDAARRVRLRLAVGWTVLMLEVLRQLAYLVTRTYTPDIVPLHLCAFATLAVFVDAVRPNRWTGDFLYALGWWGALAADVFPDWANRPILNIFTWQSFAIHALILGYVAMRLVAWRTRPRRPKPVAGRRRGRRRCRSRLPRQPGLGHQLLVSQRRLARLTAGAHPRPRRPLLHPGPDRRRRARLDAALPALGAARTPADDRAGALRDVPLVHPLSRPV